MKQTIFKLETDCEDYLWVDYVDESLFDYLFAMRGQKYAPSWQTIIVRKVEDKPERILGDYPTFAGGIPLISERGKNIIENYISNLVEFLPVQFIDSDKKYYVMNVTNILDCLDTDKSKIKYFDDGGIMEIREYIFKPISDTESQIFRIKGHEKDIYVNTYIKKIIETAELKGFSFKDTSLPYENPFSKLLRKN